MRNERGSVVVLALIILVVLTLFGVMSTNIAQVELLCASADMQHKKAFYNAEAGANIALADLRNLVHPYKSDWAHMPDPITFTNLIYSIPNSTMQFSVSMTPKRNTGGHIILWGDTNNDAIAEENTSVGYPIMIVTSTGTAPGNASDIIEVIARMDAVFNKIPAPLYGAKGIDQSGSAQSARSDGQYYIGSFDCPDVDMSDNYDAITLVGTGSNETALKFCTVKTCGDPIKPSDNGPGFPVVKTIDNLKIKESVVTIPTNPPGKSVFGSLEEPGIFYCPGNLATENLTVYGILLVEGNVELTGNANAIRGMALVKGTSLIKGGGKVATYGAWIGEGMVTLDGGVELYYDCRVFQNLTTKYEKYHMICWMEK